MIVKTPGTCGGRARIDGTRIAVWILHSFWNSGASDEQVLDSYPHLSLEQLQAAREYIKDNLDEIINGVEEKENQDD